MNVRQRTAVYEATPLEHLALMRLLGTYALRLGEGLAIPDTNFDPTARTLKIDQSWSRSRVIGPKTEAGDRTLILADDDVALLLEARSRARRIPNMHGLLFPAPKAATSIHRTGARPCSTPAYAVLSSLVVSPSDLPECLFRIRFATRPSTSCSRSTVSICIRS